MRKIFALLTVTAAMLLLMNAASFAASGAYNLTSANTDGTFSSESTAFASYATAYEAFCASIDPNAVIIDSGGKVCAMKSGMVITYSDSSTLVYSSYYPGGISAYVSNRYVGYYLNTDSSMYVTFSLSDFTGTAHLSEVILIPSAQVYPLATGARPARYEFDYYTKSSSGELVHYLSTYSTANACTNFSAIVIDKAPEFMAAGVRYYSVDSFHYYTDPYSALENNSTSSAYAGFHCIYFKYLSFRTKTTYSESQLNAYIAYRNATYASATRCAYHNLGTSFLNAQNTYGVNAAMEIAFANHESGYGKSYYAVNRHNIFGINAVDSNPDNANYYTSTAECIRQHAYYTLSQGYFDAKTDSRYFGAFPGGKGGGINVKYASDPWHGEKLASHTYQLDSYLGFGDYGKCTVGITSGAAKAYLSPDLSSNVLYEYTAGKSAYATVSGMGVCVLGESEDFYIVQSEMPITTNHAVDYTAEYDYARSIVYVPKTEINLVYVSAGFNSEPDQEGGGELPPDEDTTLKFYDNSGVSDFILENTNDNGYVLIYSGTNPVTTGIMKTGYNVQYFDSADTFIEAKEVVVYGDIDGDGAVNTTDIVLMRRFLAKLNGLDGVFRRATDINNDNNFDTTDLVLLRRYLAGLTDIKE